MTRAACQGIEPNRSISMSRCVRFSAHDVGISFDISQVAIGGVCR